MEGIILKISPLTFGIYLIHMNVYLAKLYWPRIIKFIDVNSLTVFIWYILCVIGIYIVCTIIDYIRYICSVKMKQCITTRRKMK